MTERELVRCGCSLVRNDEDGALPLAYGAWVQWGDGRSVVVADFVTSCEPPKEFEPARACRGCGCVYMLPKPSAPKEENDAK